MTPPITEAAAERLPEARRLPVFASADGRRGRALGLVGRVAAGLTLFWLAALLAGAMGLGHLPGVPLPKSEEGGAAPAAPHTGGSAAQPADGSARTTTGSHRHGGTVHSSASRSSAGRDSGIAPPPRGRVGAGNSARRDRLPQPSGLGRGPAGTPA